MNLEFHVIDSPIKGLRYQTGKTRVRVGRAEDNDLVLNQASVSRQHAIISQYGQTVTVEDLDSRNSTYIEGTICRGRHEVKHGDVITFGDVKVQVLIPEAGASYLQGENEETTPKAAVMAALSEYESSDAEPTQNAESPEEKTSVSVRSDPPSYGDSTIPAKTDGDGPEEFEYRFWKILAAIVGIAIVAVVINYFLNQSGAANIPVAKIGTSLRVGEVKIVEVPRGFVHEHRITPPDLARIERPLNLNIAVTVEGLSQGMAAATLRNEAGNTLLLYINILPAARRQTGDMEPLSPQEREIRAREKMLLAESLRLNQRTYEAKVQYAEITEMLYSLGGTAASLQRSAESKRSELAREIDKRHEDLRFETSTLVKLGRKREALRRLEDIMELIPEESDLRHQNANMLHRMLFGIIERESR